MPESKVIPVFTSDLTHGPLVSLKDCLINHSSTATFTQELLCSANSVTLLQRALGTFNNIHNIYKFPSGGPHFYLISEWSRTCLVEPAEGLAPPGQSPLYLPAFDPKALARIKLSRCCQITQSGGEMSFPLFLRLKKGYSGRSQLGRMGDAEVSVTSSPFSFSLHTPPIHR